MYLLLFFFFFFFFFVDAGVTDIPDEGTMTEYERGLLKKFHTADENKDQNLDTREFFLFVHPHTSEAMIQHVVKEQIGSYDKNNDGFISRREYMRKNCPQHMLHVYTIGSLLRQERSPPVNCTPIILCRVR